MRNQPMKANSIFVRIAVLFAVLVLVCQTVSAGGRKQNEHVVSDGESIWQNNFDVSWRAKGKYNIYVHALDRAGNESVSGPFNLKIDPNSGLPEVRVVYPENNTVIRHDVNILGIAASRYGVSKVLVRLNDGEEVEASGTDYWNKLIAFSGIPDGKHVLRVRALDDLGMAGNETKVNFILDTAPPVLEMASHAVGDIISGTVTFKGLVSDANGLQSLAYSHDGVNFINLSGKKRGNGLEFSVSFKSKEVPDGPVIFYLRAVDSTGRASLEPYLFFVSNTSPQLELFTPSASEDVFDQFFLSGRAYAKVGITRVFYEYGKVKEDIAIRAGDPFWSVALEAGLGSSIKVTALDKAGNAASVTRKLEDRRKVKAPVAVIDYPSEAELGALPANASIYGHILPGGTPKSVTVDGIGDLEAMPSFRISADQIPAIAKKSQTLKITPVAANGARGSAVSVKFVKSERATQSLSQVTVTSPEKFGWVSGSSMALQGTTGSRGGQLQYRLDPSEGEGGWKSIAADAQGNFSADISILNRPEGPMHLELRMGSELPVYHPVNRAAESPDLQFVFPGQDNPQIHGNKTVIGFADSTVPVRKVAYSLDGSQFTEIPFSSRYGRTWFSYFCNFTALKNASGRLVFRITDASGASVDKSPVFTYTPNPPIPQLIVNGPVDGAVITSAFDISGVAFDDVGIDSVFWRILGPSFESITPGAAGNAAREAAARFAENPNVMFRQLKTEQNFSIPVDFTMITDGEYSIEVYVTDPYGVKSETMVRTIKVSTEPPETRIMAPVITRYNNHAIMMQGYSSDANGIRMVNVSMDNGNTWQDVALSENGNWEITLNTISYRDGIYSALINTEDKYGVTSISNAMVNIDNTPPELYLSSPQSGQRVGSTLPLAGRVSDNIDLKSLHFQLISAENPENTIAFDLEPKLVILENLSFGKFPQGEYIVRIVATDLADNESIVARKVVYDADDKAAQIAIFNPLPGEIHTGPINVVGIVSGALMPETVQLMLNGAALAVAEVDRYGVFRYEIPVEMLEEEKPYRIYAHYKSETNMQIASPSHTVYYSPYGPVLSIDSHKDGDVITKRPWLEGRVWYSAPPLEEGERLTRKQKAERVINKVEVSYDNGRTFSEVTGGNVWKYRMEAGMLPVGPQPVLVRAKFANGAEAVRRIMLYVDTQLPQVETIAPSENSTHRDSILVYGTSGDNYELANVSTELRKGDKFFYSVPLALQGLYLDGKFLGATIWDVGIGLSFFSDNVRLQVQFGVAPPNEETGIITGGRFTGSVIGLKLIANIFHLPFDYMFGPDWAFYSMNFAVGANFSYFTMNDELHRDALFMGAIIGQWDIANVDFSFFNEKWKYFRNFALYYEPELWFASTDMPDVPKVIFKNSFGIRVRCF